MFQIGFPLILTFKNLLNWGVWHTSLIPELYGQRQKDLQEFKISLIYRANSRTPRATQRNPVSGGKWRRAFNWGLAYNFMVGNMGSKQSSMVLEL